MAVTPQDVAKLRADEAMLRAQLQRLREQIATGELILLEPFNERLFNEARRIRDVILSAPARYSAELAAELGVDQWDMLQVLNTAARTLLTMAAGSGPFPTPAPVKPVKRVRRHAAMPPRAHAAVVTAKPVAPAARSR